VARVRQERLPRGHGLQDAALPLPAEILGTFSSLLFTAHKGKRLVSRVVAV